jgi:hypothetical protein
MRARWDGPLEFGSNPTLVSPRPSPSKIARTVDRVGVLGPLVMPISLDAREPQRQAAAIQLRALEVHAATSTGMGALASCAAVLPRIALLAPRPRRPTTRS